MSGYTRAIHRIERSADYMSAKPVNRYASYRLTAYEQAAGVQRHERQNAYGQAADSAASWLSIARTAQKQLEDMIKELGGEKKLEERVAIKESIDQLIRLINEWESGYRRSAGMLKPEIWEAVELALRHPTVELLEIKRGMDGQFYWEGSSKQDGMGQVSAGASTDALHEDASRLQRLLLGAEGLLMDLKRAMSYAEQQRPVDLLRLPFAAAYPYALYYGASQAYYPLPPRGSIINKLV